MERPTLHVNGTAVTVPPWRFAALVDPLPTESFFSDYWGAKPLHVARRDPAFYSSLFGLSELERYFSLEEFFDRESVVVTAPDRSGGHARPSSLSELYGYLGQGSSLRLRRMERFIDPAAPVISLMRDMQLALQHPLASLSCYVTPASGIGLGPHHDEMEIFTLQVSGSKRWRLFHVEDTNQPARHDPGVLGPPTHDFVLEAGDLLYLPRGWVHEVTNDAASFSLTIVFDPLTWRALLDLLVARLANTAPFTKPLPAGVILVRDGRRPASVAREFAEHVALVRDALDGLSVDDVLAEVAVEQVRKMTIPPTRQLAGIFEMDQMSLETVLEKRPGVACHVRRRGDRVELVVSGGNRMEVNAVAEPALRSVADSTGPFRVVDMHDSLGALGKLALAQRLVTSGLLHVVV
jgi:ribosomal protein L16 Arg81 hydroxylase